MHRPLLLQVLPVLFVLCWWRTVLLLTWRWYIVLLHLASSRWRTVLPVLLTWRRAILPVLPILLTLRLLRLAVLRLTWRRLHALLLLTWRLLHVLLLLLWV